MSRAVRCALALIAGAGVACARVVDFDVPGDVARIAAVTIDEGGRVASATGLLPPTEALTISAAETEQVLLVGFTAAQLAPFAPPGAEMLAATRLVAPGACDTRLPRPSWSAVLDARGAPLATPAELPPLTASWLRSVGGECKPTFPERAGVAAACASGRRCAGSFTRQGCGATIALPDCGAAELLVRLSDTGGACSTDTAGCTVTPGATPDGFSFECQGGERCEVDLAPHAEIACAAGRCAIASCERGWADCAGGFDDGCETRLGTDSDCAACGDRCPSGTACTGGRCAPGIVEIAAGHSHACARSSTGRVYCWGSNTSLQLASPEPRVFPSAVAVPGVDKAVKLTAGAFHTCAILENGKATCWGQGGFGQLANGTLETSSTPREATGADGLADIAGGGSHTCAATRSGALHCAGANGVYQLGQATPATSATFLQVPGVSGVHQVAAGTIHTCAIGDEAIFCFGSNANREVTVGRREPTLPTKVEGLPGTVEIVAADTHTCARNRLGQVTCWGGTFAGQLGNGTADTVGSRAQAVLPAPARMISAKRLSTIALLETGEVWGWGLTDAQQIGPPEDADDLDIRTPRKLPFTEAPLSIALGGTFGCMIDARRAVSCWGWDGAGALGSGVLHARLTPGPGVERGAREVVARGDTTCMRSTAGAVTCWGQDLGGQLGAGQLALWRGPTQVNLPSPAAQVGLAVASACARLESGAVWCWGANGAGERGHATSSLAPDPVRLIDDALDLSSGETHHCAVRAGGKLWCWGNPADGRTGTPPDASGATPPRAVPGVDGAEKVAAGARHTCAIAGGGQVVCFGANDQGQLGRGTFTATESPGPVTGLQDAVEISAGSAYTCARTSAGRVLCWGANASGQLGDGRFEKSALPREVAGIADAVAISAGAEHACIVRAGGAVDCFGANALGALGDGTQATRATPVHAAGISRATSIAAGRDHTCAVIATRVSCWGASGFGQLGDADAAFSTTPIRVLGLE